MSDDDDDSGEIPEEVRQTIDLAIQEGRVEYAEEDVVAVFRPQCEALFKLIGAKPLFYSDLSNLDMGVATLGGDYPPYVKEALWETFGEDIDIDWIMTTDLGTLLPKLMTQFPNFPEPVTIN